MKERKTGIKAAILTMSVVQMGTNAISPILADIAASFPEADASTIQFLMTFPSLMVLAFSLVAAAAAAYFLKDSGCAHSSFRKYAYRENIWRPQAAGCFVPAES